jgi:hypothetical protein
MQGLAHAFDLELFMTASEYLKTLQELAKAFAHADPIPPANKSYHDRIEDMVPRSVHDLAVKLSQHFRLAQTAERFGFDDVTAWRSPTYSYATLIDDMLERLKRYHQERNLVLPPLACLGILPIGSLDAVALRVPDSLEYLIVFNEGLFTFLYYYAKIITVASKEVGLKPHGQQDFGRWHIRGECRDRFRDLFLNYVLHGRAERAKQWFLEQQLLSTLGGLTLVMLNLFTPANSAVCGLRQSRCSSRQFRHVLKTTLEALDEVSLKYSPVRCYPVVIPPTIISEMQHSTYRLSLLKSLSDS